MFYLCHKSICISYIYIHMYSFYSTVFYCTIQYLHCVIVVFYIVVHCIYHLLYDMILVISMC